MTLLTYETTRNARTGRGATVAERLLGTLGLLDRRQEPAQRSVPPAKPLTHDEIETGLTYLLNRDRADLVRRICTRDLGHVTAGYLHLDCDLAVGKGGHRVYLVTATAVDEDGTMEPVGFGAVDAGDAESWTRFLLSLRVRGLASLDVIGSTCADRVRDAVAAAYPGTQWRPSGPLAALV